MGKCQTGVPLAGMPHKETSMRTYTYNTDIGTFEIREVGHQLYELWIEDENLGFYDSPESAAADVAAFNTGYIEWDRFENEEANVPADLGKWNFVTAQRPD